MKRLLALAAVAATTLTASLNAAAGPEVGVSITVAQPGVYGRIDLGRHPHPVLVSAQPVVVVPQRMSVRVPPQPVPLWVPDNHRRHWARHCAAYGACGVPVVFVHERWARDHLHRPHVRGQRPPAHRGHVDHRHPHRDRHDRHPGRGHRGD